MKYFVSNLYFPLGHSKLKIRNYVFEKLENPIEKKTGHKITSIVQNFKKESCSKIGKHPAKNSTELDDISLILSLFTSNDVFYTEKESINKLFADPRPFSFSILSNSLNTYFVRKNGNLIVEGFEEEINKIIKLIRNKNWLTKYNNGVYLLMMKEAMKKQSRESMFLNCWIIWEHLFFILNKKYFSNETLKNISARDKINFLLTKFIFVKGINKKENKKLQELADIRNYIVHYGFEPTYASLPKEFWLFIHITQFIVAKTLKLKQKDLFNTFQLFEEYLKENKIRKKIKKFFE